MGAARRALHRKGWNQTNAHRAQRDTRHDRRWNATTSSCLCRIVSVVYAAKDYRGDIRIEDCPDGSRIIWTVTFAPRIPGLPKNLIKSRIGASYTRLAAALAREAEGATRME